MFGRYLQICFSGILPPTNHQWSSVGLLINLVIKGTRTDWVGELILEKVPACSQGIGDLSMQSLCSKEAKTPKGLLLAEVFQAIV